MRSESFSVNRAAIVRRVASVLLIALPSLSIGAAETASKEAQNRAMAASASQAVRTARALPIPDLEETNIRIYNRKFVEFEAQSKEYERAFQADPLYESPLLKLYEALGHAPGGVRLNDDFLRSQLDEWVKTRPSYMSLSARGLYLVSVGYEHRGTEYIRDIPEEKLALMRQALQAAREDLIRAQRQNPQFPVPYVGLIQIEQAFGSDNAAAQWEKTASKEIPYNYYVRFAYIGSLHPRWGGSYTGMETYAKSIDRAAVVNARVWSLKGEASAERGYSSFLEGDYKAAIEHYTHAISFGDRRDFYYYRGQSYERLNQNVQALADFKKCVEINGSDPRAEARIQRLSM